MLEARTLSFGYRGVALGSAISLGVEAGEKVCVLGPNGGGKTTLFKTLLGLLPPIGGNVLLNGAPLAAFKREEVARQIAYVPQAHATFFPFSVTDVVLMGRAARISLFGAPTIEDRRIVTDVLAKLGITLLADKPYTQISGGERQLVLLARALAQEPRCIVMDEPMASLDLGNQSLVLDQIAALAATGLAVVYSSHHPDHALVCADRVALLRRGEMIAFGTPEAVVSSAALSELYEADVEVAHIESLGRRVCVLGPQRSMQGDE